MAGAASKLALGTVQFGLDYGISNTQGKVEADQVAAILACCRKHGIQTLDTAAAYGNSEFILGKALVNQADYFRVISKTRPGTAASQILPEFQNTLSRLGLTKLGGYLVHDFHSYERDPQLYEQLIQLQQAGQVDKIGFSLYYPKQLENLLELKLPMQLVQIPFNIFDQRFAYLLPELGSLGIEVHVRSVFLQGLFFRSPESLPVFFAPLLSQLQALHRIQALSQVPLSSLLLSFVHLQPGISQMVIGVTSEAELKQNLTYLGDLEQVKAFITDLSNLAVRQEELLLPFNWPTS
ncbi:MAG: aldo/keto reductase [Adhaeribacter sp.]